MKHITKRLFTLLLAAALLCGTAFAANNSPVFQTDTSDTDKVTTSNKNALLIADAGVQAPAVAPGEIAAILMPLVVNREYLPSDLYILRNITIRPVIPTTNKDIVNWPFLIDSISYVRHLDDMTYNSRADVEYQIPVAETAQKGVYPISFSIYATVWRYDVLNGTDITEDVEFTVTIYVTVTEDGAQSGITSDLGALTVVAVDEDGQHIPTPRGNCGDRIAFSLPLMNRGYNITDVTITPKVSANLNEFPFVSEAVNYGQILPSMKSGEMVMVEFDFLISPYATQGNKPVTFEIVYRENGAQRTCDVTSYVYIVNGYEEPPTASAPSVTIAGYTLTVGEELVDKLYAGDEAVLTLMIRNNDAGTTARKVRIGASIDTKVLLFQAGETDTKYLASIAPGKTAEVTYLISAVNDAAEGSTSFSVNMNYENWEVVSASASQTLPISIRQPVRVDVGDPTVYDDGAQPGDPIALNLNIVNMGRSKIYNVSIGVEGGTLDMYEDYYGGDVLPAAKLSADVLVTAEKAGRTDGTLLLSFEDSDGAAYTEEVPFTVTVAERPAPAEQLQTGELNQPKKGAGAGAVAGTLGLLAAGGGGAGWWLLRRRKRDAVS